MSRQGRQGYVAIVDYGLGNIFSVQNACRHFGCEARLTGKSMEIQEADAIILPGVGAFAMAMRNLAGLGLIGILRDSVAMNKPFMGICLGMQLLFERSHEFGISEGLGILRGEVLRLASDPDAQGRNLKIPEVGWSAIHPPRTGRAGAPVFSVPFLAGLPAGSPMYFVHSFYVSPQDSSVVSSVSRFGSLEYCSSISRGKLMACQFHPEKSGMQGLKIYENFFAMIEQP